LMQKKGKLKKSISFYFLPKNGFTMLIAIEGIDGCGKGTQIELLRTSFPDCVVFKYPTRGFSMLNDYLEKKVELDPKSLFLLFLSDIANEQRKVRAALDEGKLVILDRYVFSTIAYELDDIAYEHGKRIVENVGFIRPDKVLLLDVPSEVSHQRKKFQKALDRYESDIAYLEKVRSNFVHLYEDRFLCKEWVKIDATKTVDEVHSMMMKALSPSDIKTV